MPDVKISDLPAATAPTDTTELEINRAGTSQRMTLLLLFETYLFGAVSGFLARTGVGTRAMRTLVGTAPVAVADGAGVAGNPTISVTKATTAQAQAGSGTNLMDATLTAAAITALATGGAAAWAPHDPNNLMFYQGHVDPDVNSVTTPDWADGYDYMLELRGIRPSRAEPSPHVLNITPEYQGVATLARAIAVSALIPPSTITVFLPGAGSRDIENRVASSMVTRIEVAPVGARYDYMFQVLAPRVARPTIVLHGIAASRGATLLSEVPPLVYNGAWQLGNGGPDFLIRRLHISWGQSNTLFTSGQMRLYRRTASLR